MDRIIAAEPVGALLHSIIQISSLICHSDFVIRHSPYNQGMSTPNITPIRLDLKKTEKLDIDWQDGLHSVYPLSYLRTMCPCALCRTVREETKAKKSLLNILPGNFADPLTALSAELVGNYALQIEWSDKHGSGIYSFQYLREISPAAKS